MPEFPVRLVPITGGYALHYDPCDHPENTTPGRSRVMAVGSVSEAVAEWHTFLPSGLTQPARIVRRDCAANVPMQPIEPMSWQERHGHYIREAATVFREYADMAVQEVRAGAAAIEASRYDDDGRHDPVWYPSESSIRAQVRRARLATLALNCIGGAPKGDSGAERIIKQAEEVYRRELGWLAMDTTQYADSMDRAFADSTRAASMQFLNFAKYTLRKIVAHRTLRDAVA